MLQLTSPRRGADKLKFLAGSESAMGAWIGDIPPEQAAAAIREAIARADRDNPVGELPVAVSGLVTASDTDTPEAHTADAGSDTASRSDREADR
jgi:UDPglucose--hexose-1-phosphate uridylyltransferase